MKNVIDQILDEKNTANIKIPGKSGEIFTFEQVALIHLEEASYAILHPIANDVLPDDVLIFKIIIEHEEASLELEEDEEVIEECFDEYYRLLKKNKK
ncbi:MAG: DUF1292 domain-containing protein [Roseburia sp.]|nr:DUF1292 domain-containing protein [Anaeroplasma bactoclasticum]MCM1196105.1 DUF1292 domain-containing protein [Roseburia sp.]